MRELGLTWEELLQLQVGSELLLYMLFTSHSNNLPAIPITNQPSSQPSLSGVLASQAQRITKHPWLTPSYPLNP